MLFSGFIVGVMILFEPIKMRDADDAGGDFTRRARFYCAKSTVGLAAMRQAHRARVSH